MNVDRSILEDYLSKKFFNILINKSEELEIYNYANKLYNFPKGTMAIGRLDEDSEGLCY